MKGASGAAGAIGAVIVAHGALAEGLRDAAEAIFGKTGGIAAVSVQAGESTDAIRDRLERAIKMIDRGFGVIIFTDMFGGTPSNMSLSLLSEHNMDVLTGVNLPMVLKFLNRRDKDRLPELVASLVKCGRENIVLAGEMLKITK